jgi:hypothetical protein
MMSLGRRKRRRKGKEDKNVEGKRNNDSKRRDSGRVTIDLLENINLSLP